MLMKCNIKCHTDSNYISAFISGEVSVERVKKLAIELIGISKQTNVTRFLVDYRNGSLASSVTEVHKLPETLLELGISANESFALVYQAGSPRAHLFNFFESLCVFRPLNIKVFTNYDEAYQWLITKNKRY